MPNALAWPQIPTLGFLYIAGYIGYVGRDYLTQVLARVTWVAMIFCSMGLMNSCKFLNP